MENQRLIPQSSLSAKTTVKAVLNGPNYRTHVTARPHNLVSDEAESYGGTDAGFNPFELVLAGLAACTTATLKIYVDRKGWSVGDIHTTVKLDNHDKSRPRFDLFVSVTGDLTAEQYERLLTIAQKCPVHKLLTAMPDMAVTLVGRN